MDCGCNQRREVMFTEGGGFSTLEAAAFGCVIALALGIIWVNR